VGVSMSRRCRGHDRGGHDRGSDVDEAHACIIYPPPRTWQTSAWLVDSGWPLIATHPGEFASKGVGLTDRRTHAVGAASPSPSAAARCSSSGPAIETSSAVFIPGSIVIKTSLSRALSGLKSPYVNTPISSPSPGPGWWLASDGKWYPQRWETYFIYCTNESLQALVEEVAGMCQTYGGQGWEIVNSTIDRSHVSSRQDRWANATQWIFQYSIVCTLKRPLPNW
jgi:hypothetical protein